MADEILTNEIKEEEVLDSDVSKPSAYSEFAFNVTSTGQMMPTGALTDFSLQFGGDGSDGAFALSAAETYDIDVSGARVYEINWKSLSISGTASLTFSNPHSEGTLVFIKVQGDCNLTSTTTPMIDMSAMGAVGGDGTNNNNSGGLSYFAGTDGTDGRMTPIQTEAGTGATTVPAVGTGGPKITAATFIGIYPVTVKYPGAFPGAGGGGGGKVSSFEGGPSSRYSGDGGVGGGALVMEVAGSFNFTTTNGISVAGGAGEKGDTGVSSSTAVNCCGGGGGGGGSCFILYRNLIANSGTVNVAGGVGGENSDTVSLGTCYGGGGGGSGDNAGNSGSTATGGAIDTQTGGNGGDGYQLVAQNTYYG